MSKQPSNFHDIAISLHTIARNLAIDKIFEEILHIINANGDEQNYCSIKILTYSLQDHLLSLLVPPEHVIEIMLKGSNGKCVIECHPFDKDKIKLTDHGYNVLLEIKLNEIENEKNK